MENRLRLTWNIYNGEIAIEERYCHNCGKKVEFKDSLKRRQNANGKNIYHFAIYKCLKGHSWNKQLDIFKAKPGLENDSEEFFDQESQFDEIVIGQFKQERITNVEIYMNTLQKKVRIDKFLSSKIQDMTREKIVDLINLGFIKINDKEVRSKANLKEKDVIDLLISEF